MSKLFNKKDVISWSNCEEAKKYIGQEGYFGDSLESLEAQIRRQNLLKLGRIDASNAICFHTLERDELDFDTGSDECLFLPADKVKEVEEKKYRAFKDFNEFKYWTGKRVGSVIVYRDKLTNDEIEAVITRSKLYENFVEIGAVEYTFKELFEQWEWLSDGNEWHLFGVEK